MKFPAVAKFLFTVGFNKNRSCIEILASGYCFKVEGKFNKNRSCIEIPTFADGNIPVKV